MHSEGVSNICASQQLVAALHDSDQHGAMQLLVVAASEALRSNIVVELYGWRSGAASCYWAVKQLVLRNQAVRSSCILYHLGFLFSPFVLIEDPS